MKALRSVVFLLTVVAVFVAGYGYGRWYAKPAVVGATAKGRRIVYWYDPMHPAYKSDKPGIAPDCGMELVPFSADEAPVPESAAIDAKTQDLPMAPFESVPKSNN